MNNSILSSITGISADSLANGVSSKQITMELYRSLNTGASWFPYDVINNNEDEVVFYLNEQSNFLIGQTFNGTLLTEALLRINDKNHYVIKDKVFDKWSILNFCTTLPKKEEMKPNLWYIKPNDSLNQGITNNLSKEEKMLKFFTQSKIFPTDTSFILMYLEDNQVVVQTHHFRSQRSNHMANPYLDRFLSSPLITQQTHVTVPSIYQPKTNEILFPETKEKPLYAVIFYTSYRKENDWRIHAIYENKEEALAFAKKWSSNQEDDDHNVQPNEHQNVLHNKYCGNHEEEKTDTPKPYNRMSWTPSLAVVEVPFIKRFP
jgi:hypothetical protein